MNRRLGRHVKVIFMNVKLNGMIDDMVGTNIHPVDGRATVHTAIDHILSPKYQIPANAVAMRFVRWPPFYSSKISRIHTGIFIFTENQTNVQWVADATPPASILDA